MTVSKRCLLILLAILFIFSAASTLALQGEECYEYEGEIVCYPGEGGGNGGSGGDDGDDDDDENEPPWPGLTDGRLNPSRDEYYTLYCHDDTLFIVRTVPETETIKTVDLVDIIALAVGEELALGDFMTLLRNTEDTVTVYGSNGNLAPQAGQKAFSLSECIAHNGGAPIFDDDSNVEPGPTTETETLSPEAERERRRLEAQDRLDFCFASFEFLQDAWLFVGCLNDTLTDYRDVLNGDEILSLIMMIFCLNILVGNGILPIGIVLSLGLYRRWLRRWNPRTRT